LVELLPEALAALPPVVLQIAKRSVDAIAREMDRAIVDMDADQWILTTRSRDFDDGVRTFFEKRMPKLTGD
jgi:enoyl-CoA hydratase/carnithine racemase